MGEKEGWCPWKTSNNAQKGSKLLNSNPITKLTCRLM